MIRFIFACMGVVALSVIAIGSQYMLDGIRGETATVAARNAEIPAQENVALETTPSAQDLNDIDTAAGGTIDPSDTFEGGFTNEAPKGLEDAPAAFADDTAAFSPDAARDIPVAGPPVSQAN
jgi:hypothetical protein